MREQPPQRAKPQTPPPVVVLPPGATPMDQLVYQQLAEIQRTLGSLIPLLTQIITHLEAQVKQPEVPVATYEAMYADQPIVPGPPEGELVTGTQGQGPQPQASPRSRGWWGRLFPTRSAG